MACNVGVVKSEVAALNWGRAFLGVTFLGAASGAMYGNFLLCTCFILRARSLQFLENLKGLLSEFTNSQTFSAKSLWIFFLALHKFWEN